MTLVVGLKFENDIVLAADREEGDSYLRHEVQKIQRLEFPSKILAGITGAGDGHFIDYATERLADYLLTHPELTLAGMSQTIETVLKDVFAQHIVPSNFADRFDFGLLVAVNHGGKSRLFKTQQAAALEVFDFAALGYGGSYATILLDKLRGTLTLQSAVLLGLHVVQQTKKYVPSVGGGTDIVILGSNGKSSTITSALTKPLEEKLERLDSVFNGAFFSALWVVTGHETRIASGRGQGKSERN